MDNNVTTPIKMAPCPFCGKDARESYPREGDSVCIRCVDWGNKCLGAGPYKATVEEAVLAWNTRSHDDLGALLQGATHGFALYYLHDGRWMAEQDADNGEWRRKYGNTPAEAVREALNAK